MNRSGFLTTLMVAALGVTLAPAVSAQRVQPQERPQTQEQQQEQAARFDEKELRSFAVVVLEVQRINTAYLPMFQAAGSPEEQEKVVNAAEAEVNKVVENQGMSMGRFNEILAYTQANNELANRVKQYIKEEAK